MPTKEKVLDWLRLLKKDFLIPFGVFFFLLNIYFYFSSLEVPGIQKNIILVLELILGYVLFFTWLLNLSKKRDLESFLENTALHFFISIFSIIVIVNSNIELLPNFEWLGPMVDAMKVYNVYFVIFALGFGFFTFYLNTERVIREVNTEKALEKIENGIRTKKFYTRFSKKWNKPNSYFLRFFHNLMEWGYTEGIHIFALSLLLVVTGFFIFSGIGNYGFQGDEYYNASIAQNYFSIGSLDITPSFGTYSRSVLVSIAAIASKDSFNYLHIPADDEFAYRFPVAIFSLLTIIIFYSLGKKYSTRLEALLFTGIVSTDVLFIYFAKYLRFYSFSLFLMSLSLWLYFENKKNIWLVILIGVISFWGISDYVTLTTIFLVCLYLLQTNLSYQKKIILIFVFVCFLEFAYLISTKANYYSFNGTFLKDQLNWLVDNYLSSIVLFGLLSLIIFLKKTGNSTLKILILFGIFDLLFFLFYVNNATDFNITFRVWYLIIPFILPLSLFSLRFFIKNKNFYILILIGILSLNILIALNFNITQPGDKYYPFKLVSEDDDIVGGTKDLTIFLNSQVASKNLGTYNIYIVGNGAIFYYLEKYNLKANYFFSSIPTADSNSYSYFEETLATNTSKENYIVCYFNAHERFIPLQAAFFGVEEKSAANPEICNSLQRGGRLIYQSTDGFSKIYLI